MGRLSRGRARRESERKAGGSPLMFWLRLIVIFILVGVLMVQVIRTLDQNYWQQSELDTAVYRFGQTAMLVNTEWLRNGRRGPVEITLGSETRTQRSIIVDVNESGWPLPRRRNTDLYQETATHVYDTGEAVQRINMNHVDCAALWSLLTQTPQLLNLGLETLWLDDSESCLYRFKGHDVFTYRLKNGHVQIL